MTEEERQAERFAVNMAKVGVCIQVAMTHAPHLFTPPGVIAAIREESIRVDALTILLISKGLITKAEYDEALVVSAEGEVERQRVKLSELMGHNVVIL